ncbi:MAG: endolytic transglycosylase MltG [Cellulosilyticaceae bacterium]
MKKGKTYLRLLLNLFITIGILIFGIAGSSLAFSEGFNYTLNILEESKARQLNPNIRQVQVEVTDSFTIEELTNLLYENNFIVNKLSFSLLGQLNNSNQKFIPGNYSISSNMTNSEILDLLTTSIHEENTVKFTIPEGFTVSQIANRLDDLDIVMKEDFFKAVNERDYAYAFLSNIPSDSKHKLEGYLFPDTYIVNKDVTSEEIIIKMLNRFEQVMSQYSQYIYNSPYSLHELVTIASIIEHEAKLSEERPVISGVIYNRLESNMMLQMCSTVQYDLQKRKSNLSYEDLEIDSPYNTYKQEGLPLGPICAPGEESLKAAMLPEAHDYYYFVLKDPKVGSHAFSRNASEHEQNKLTYVQITDKNFIK